MQSRIRNISNSNLRLVFSGSLRRHDPGKPLLIFFLSLRLFGLAAVGFAVCDFSDNEAKDYAKCCSYDETYHNT